MTPERFRKIRSIANQLTKLQVKADEIDLQLGNGGHVGSLLGSMRDELDQMLSFAEAQRKAEGGKKT